MRAWLLLAALALGVRDLSAQAGGIVWEPSLEAARAKAKQENKPLFVAFLMMNEPANEEVMRVHFRRPDIIAESRNFICVASCPGVHGENPEAICSELGTISCKHHDTIAPRARLELLESMSVSCPQFLFLTPDSKTTLVHSVWLIPPEELLDKMKLARALFDPENAPAGFRDRRDQVARLLTDAAHRNQATRGGALRTLARLDDPRIVDFFVAQTGKLIDSSLRLEAIKFMRAKGNAKVLSTLHKLLQENDAQVRSHVAATLEGIGMEESTKPLLEIMKKESKDRVRAHLWRAVLGCSRDLVALKAPALEQVKKTGQLDQSVGLWVAAQLPPDPELNKRVVAALNSNNDLVRAAACFAAGQLRIAEAKPILDKLVKGARGHALGHLRWAQGQLVGEAPEDAVDPLEFFLAQFPDNGLYGE